MRAERSPQMRHRPQSRRAGRTRARACGCRAWPSAWRKARSCSLLLQSRGLNIWPGNDGYLFSALALAALFAPLLLLEGLGEIALPELLFWTAGAAAALASVGLYHHWRLQTGEQVHAGLGLIATTALALVIAQAWLRAGMRDRKFFAGYRACFDVTWTLAARLLVWAGVTACAWALVGSGISVMNWLRAHIPTSIPPSIRRC